MRASTQLMKKETRERTNRRLQWISGVVFVLAPMIFAPAYAQQSAEVLLQSGLYKEDVNGDLEAALVIYARVLKEFPQDRSAAAKALLHTGLCYEKLGKQEAQKAYRRLIEEYADQLEVVKNARQRLASLVAVSKDLGLATGAVEGAGMTIKRIDIEEIGRTHQARLSPDGTRILYIDVQGKEPGPRYSLRAMDLSSRKSQTLVEEMDWGDILIFEWSPDGRKVVYGHKTQGLCTIDSDGGKPEVLWSCPDPNTTMYPLDWSLDGLHILAAVRNDAGATSRLVILAAQGGEPRTVVSGKAKELDGPAGFSPDGKYIVGQKTKEGNADIYIWPVEGGKEIPITNHPARDYLPFWSPDGKWIVFVSDRAKTEDLWAIPMNGPNPAGAPVCIRRNLGKNTVPIDLTPGGKLTLLVLGSGGTPPDLFVISVDPATGEARGDFRPFAKYPTEHFMPRWSADGTRIAYTSRKGNISLPRLFVSSGNQTEDLEIPVGDYYVVNVEWARDGKHLIFPGILQPDGHLGIFRVSLEDRKIEPLHVRERYGTGFKGAFVNLRWLSKAGKFMFEKVVGEKERELYTLDKEGENIELVAERFSTDYWAWPSPDGQRVAYRSGQSLELLSLEKKTSATLVKFPDEQQVEGVAWSPDGKTVVGNDRKKLTAFSVSDGSSQTLVESDDNHQISGLGWNQPWAPDGKKIAYVLRESPEGSAANAELWIVPATGGTPKKVAAAPASHPVIGEVTWHANGDMIFVTGSSGKDKGVWYEHWVMENFLPKPAGGK